MKPGDTVEAKLRPGLGNWERVRLVSTNPHVALVEKNGSRYEVPLRRVRTPKQKGRTPRKVRRCSFCDEVGHDIRNCEKLRAVSGTMQESGVNVVTRPFITERVEGKAVPKPDPYVRSEAYKQHVREFPCMWCGAPPPSDPDHVGPHGLGEKTDDLRCVPACRTCHGERTDTGRVKPHTKEKTMALIHEKQVDLLVAFFVKVGAA